MSPLAISLRHRLDEPLVLTLDSYDEGLDFARSASGGGVAARSHLLTPLRVERIDSEASLAAIESEWLALEQRSNNTLPFRTFAWVACWWRHMREDRLAVKDSLAMRCVRAPDGRLVGVAPLILTQRPSVGPLRARCLHFIGSDPNMTEVRGALCEPGLEAACFAAIYGDLLGSKREFDWLHWSGIDEGGGARESLGDANLRWSSDVVCSVLALPATWEELRSSKPRNLKESIRKCYNSLKRDGLDFSVEVVKAKTETGPAVADFFRLHSARADLADTVAHKDVFGSQASRSFLVDVCERFAERGALRIFRLWIGGSLVATRIGFVLGGSLYLYYSGYDPAYGKYSVMTTTVTEAIKWAIDEGLRSVNLSTGNDVSKQRWRPQEIVFADALFFSRHAFGRVKYETLGAARRALQQPTLGSYALRLLARRGP
jgi:CelD/BcsL family acetyltransferase involved in cellulose biosynthesis